MSNSETWECRLCAGPALTRAEISEHLATAHGYNPDLSENLFEVRLHAAKDHPEYSENTLGVYDGAELVCLWVLRRERAPDDPMGWEHLP